ncbi:MAG: response regulator, partial [Bacteroidetes bacterium]|nr:response regulator [Bacteroidota bacterium]
MTRIIIVDDHPLMRKGLIMSLSAELDVEVCAQASNAEEAMTLVESENPDLAIVD